MKGKAARPFRITRVCKHVDILRKGYTCSPEQEDRTEEEEEEGGGVGRRQEDEGK